MTVIPLGALHDAHTIKADPKPKALSDSSVLDYSAQECRSMTEAELRSKAERDGFVVTTDGRDTSLYGRDGAHVETYQAREQDPDALQEADPNLSDRMARVKGDIHREQNAVTPLEMSRTGLSSEELRRCEEASRNADAEVMVKKFASDASAHVPSLAHGTRFSALTDPLQGLSGVTEQGELKVCNPHPLFKDSCAAPTLTTAEEVRRDFTEGVYERCVDAKRRSLDGIK